MSNAKYDNLSIKKMKKIFVTEPSLPNLKSLNIFLKKIWSTKVLTNNGPFHNQLENDLKKFLGVRNISLFSNGTIALISALKALNIKGEVITTPYSFIATSHALLWNNIKPIFVDIEPISLNIDTTKIEKAITKYTTAILATHCYGNICDVKGIEKIAKKYNLKVIYDAAHAFGVETCNESILNHGDLSIVSFHATKVFNTFEGGAVISPNLKIKNQIDKLKNFGFENENEITTLGINGKMSEINAAIGILNIRDFKKQNKERERVYNEYVKIIKEIEGIEYIKPNIESPNYGYFPILITKIFPLSRNALFKKLRENNVIVRKYFYPLISNTTLYKNINSSSKLNLPVANDIANKILCLPIYPNLAKESQFKIMKLINGGLKK
jgi:dTDP-4-amino-4,6-dideoxygalactose transaminase